MAWPKPHGLHRLMAFGRWLLGYDGVPIMARPTFRYDFLSTLLSSLAAGVLMPQFTQLFACSSLQAAPWVVAFVTAGMVAGEKEYQSRVILRRDFEAQAALEVKR